MSFDPRLIHPDEPPEDFDAVLAELGNQLRDDAKMLATKYPAKPNTPKPAPWRRWAASSAAVGAAAVILAIFLSMDRIPQAPAVVTDAATPEVTPVSTANIAVSDPLDEFTGPELEGVLDLLENQDNGRASLSL